MELELPGDMLIFTIVLCYSVISPMLIPFGVLYFGLGWLILRNQALKVYVPSFESNGRMWPHMHIAHYSFSVSIPSHHVWLFWSEEILLCSNPTPTSHNVLDFRLHL
ncbi:hypothetical protein L1049_010087 [Liquidambar formosana]|uniref:CSC1/OSCA1-like 7TM region domain-containing protein n=1 Tax=Liquidambar formosana TaxID=63359 RepID=A0AAP0N8H4_LIQFO